MVDITAYYPLAPGNVPPDLTAPSPPGRESAAFSV
jgi:hypothetical protein